VLVPLTEARNHKEHAAPDVPPDNDGDVRTSSRTSPLTSAPDIPRTVRTLESAVEALREQLLKANQWAEAERGRAERAERHFEDERKRVDELRTALADAVAAERIAAGTAAGLRAEIAILTDRRSWWRRWFR
jgi:predicted  nucleic acid-binding Zn-ribbon protein